MAIFKKLLRLVWLLNLSCWIVQRWYLQGVEFRLQPMFNDTLVLLLDPVVLLKNMLLSKFRCGQRIFEPFQAWLKCIPIAYTSLLLMRLFINETFFVQIVQSIGHLLQLFHQFMIPTFSRKNHCSELHGERTSLFTMPNGWLKHI